VRGRSVFLQAGAGIVFDSVPAAEYEETVSKLRATMRAVDAAVAAAAETAAASNGGGDGGAPPPGVGRVLPAAAVPASPAR
jgi:anthranilate synthase component 1